jgi:hypothetical protein
MAIFSRRTLQRLINENSAFLTKKQIQKHIDELNKSREDAVAAEWEVVLLNALSKVGTVHHERNFGGSNPDIYFEADGDLTFSFLGDITKASDKGLHEQNAIFELYEKLKEKYIERGLDINHLYLEADGNSWEVFANKDRAKLWIPGKSRFEEVVFKSERFIKFLDEAARSPNDFHQCHFDKPYDFTIKYDPNRGSPGMTHFSYTQANSFIRNPVYGALEKKYKQLKKSDYKGVLGILLCDGGSVLFHHAEGDFGTTYGVDQIVRYFLKEYEDIGFVISFTVRSKDQYSIHTMPRAYDSSPRYEIFMAIHLPKCSAHIEKELVSLVGEIDKILPVPITHVTNALHHNNSRLRGEGTSFKGGWSVSERQIKLSARALLELLAAKVSYEEFLELHGFDRSEVSSLISGNPFEHQFDRGKLIKSISIHKSENEEDDDYVVFEFGDRDPAISLFENPLSTA